MSLCIQSLVILISLIWFVSLECKCLSFHQLFVFFAPIEWCESKFSILPRDQVSSSDLTSFSFFWQLYVFISHNIIFKYLKLVKRTCTKAPSLLQSLGDSHSVLGKTMPLSDQNIQISNGIEIYVSIILSYSVLFWHLLKHSGVFAALSIFKV